MSERLSAYVDGALDEQTLEEIEAHLAACPECRRELAALRLLVTGAGGIEPAQPPADLKHRILESVRRARVEDRRCSRVAGLLSAYVDGELPAKQQELVDAHVSCCERCAEELGTIRMLIGAAGAVSPLEPPAGLKSRIAAAVSHSHRPGYISRTIKRWRTIRRPGYISGTIKAAYAGAAIGVVAFAAVSLTRTPPEPPNTAVGRSATLARKVASDVRPATELLDDQTGATELLDNQPGATELLDGQRAVVFPDRIPPSRDLGRVVRHRARRHVTVASVKGAKITKPKAPVKPFEAAVSSDAETASDVVTAEETRPVEVAAAPPPVPEARLEGKKTEQSALAKVAAAHLAAAERAEEMMKEIRAEAAVRRGQGRTATVAIFTSRF